MIESFTVQVSPKDEAAEINFWAHFGWHVAQTREIDRVRNDISVSTDARYDQSTQTVNVETRTYNTETHTNYVTILFQRNTSMRHYNELVALQNRYFAIKDEPLPRAGAGCIVWCVIFFVISGYVFLQFSRTYFCLLGLIPLSLAIMFLIRAIRGRKKIKKARRVVEARNEGYERARQECLARARALLR